MILLRKGIEKEAITIIRDHTNHNANNAKKIFYISSICNFGPGSPIAFNSPKKLDGSGWRTTLHKQSTIHMPDRDKIKRVPVIIFGHKTETVTFYVYGAKASWKKKGKADALTSLKLKKDKQERESIGLRDSRMLETKKRSDRNKLSYHYTVCSK